MKEATITLRAAWSLKTQQRRKGRWRGKAGQTSGRDQTIDGIVFAIGRSVCSTEAALDGPAIWTARTESGRVSEWRVYDDTPESRRQLGLAT
jgi:hypothetical protein